MRLETLMSEVADCTTDSTEERTEERPVLEAMAEPATEVRDPMSDRIEEIWGSGAGLGEARTELVEKVRRRMVGRVGRILKSFWVGRMSGRRWFLRWLG